MEELYVQRNKQTNKHVSQVGKHLVKVPMEKPFKIEVCVLALNRCNAICPFPNIFNNSMKQKHRNLGRQWSHEAKRLAHLHWIQRTCFVF